MQEDKVNFYAFRPPQSAG